MKLCDFKTPDNLFRGTDFWMLNGELSEENIVEQLTEMKDKGVLWGSPYREQLKP